MLRPTAVAIACTATLACSSTGSGNSPGSTVGAIFFPPTQEDIYAALHICEEQVKSDRAAHARAWFTNWLECRRQHVMPLEFRLYPRKQQEIREMYEALIRMGPSVDTGESKVEPVYDAWDRMKEEIGMYKSECIKNPDGSQFCMPTGTSSIFVQDDDGRLIPID